MALSKRFLFVGSPEVTRVEFVVTDGSTEHRISTEVQEGEIRRSLPAPLPGQSEAGDAGPTVTAVEVFAGEQSVGYVGMGKRD